MERVFFKNLYVMLTNAVQSKMFFLSFVWLGVGGASETVVCQVSVGVFRSASLLNRSGV